MMKSLHIIRLSRRDKNREDLIYPIPKLAKKIEAQTKLT